MSSFNRDEQIIRQTALKAAAEIVAQATHNLSDAARMTLSLADSFTTWVLTGQRIDPATTLPVAPGASFPPAQPASEMPPSAAPPVPTAPATTEPPAAPAAPPVSAGTNPPAQTPSPASGSSTTQNGNSRAPRDPNDPVSEKQKSYIESLFGMVALYVVDLCAILAYPPDTATTMVSSFGSVDLAAAILTQLKALVTEEHLKAYYAQRREANLVPFPPAIVQLTKAGLKNYGEASTLIDRLKTMTPEETKLAYNVAKKKSDQKAA